MDIADEKPPRGSPDVFVYAPGHFAGSPVGESKTKHLVETHPTHRVGMKNTPGKDVGFSASRPGE